jgi:hypothetical protein
MTYFDPLSSRGQLAIIENRLLRSEHRRLREERWPTPTGRAEPVMQGNVAGYILSRKRQALRGDGRATGTAGE